MFVRCQNTLINYDENLFYPLRVKMFILKARESDIPKGYPSRIYKVTSWYYLLWWQWYISMCMTLTMKMKYVFIFKAKLELVSLILHLTSILGMIWTFIWTKQDDLNPSDDFCVVALTLQSVLKSMVVKIGSTE